MANYNIFSNENVKLRLINLEYDYKKSLHQTILKK